MENKPEIKNELIGKIVIENSKGSYKKFADSLDEYPILGVAFPCDYGYIDGYIGEDTHDLDVFSGSGNLFGYIVVKRDDVEGGLETKMLYKISEEELKEIPKQYNPVLESMDLLNSENIFLEYIEKFRINP